MSNQAVMLLNAYRRKRKLKCG